MDTFDRHQLDLMITSEGGPHISVFLPTPPQPSAARDDAIRVSNFVSQAHATLREHWMRDSEAEDFLKPLSDLVHDREFLSDRRHGLAIYLSDDLFKCYPVSQRVPEQLFVSRLFCVRPMLSVVDHFTEFWLLTLSKKEVNLYGATHESISRIEQAGLPKGFEDSMVEISISADRGSQTHSAAKDMTGKQAAVFHGQGGKPDAQKAQMTEYLRQVDDAVCRYLQNQNGCLILAGVDYLTSIYRQISSCPRLADVTVSGNVDHLSSKDLLRQAIPIATEELGREREADAVQIRQRRRHPAATDPEQVLCAAMEGRIEALFFDNSAILEGSFYLDTRTMMQLHHAPTGKPGDPCCDLIELAAVQTLRHGGRVHPVSTAEMPVDGRMAAILRY